MLSQFIVAMGKNAVPIHRSSDVVPLYRGVNLFKFMSQFTLVDSLKKKIIYQLIYLCTKLGQNAVPIHRSGTGRCPNSSSYDELGFIHFV